MKSRKETERYQFYKVLIEEGHVVIFSTEEEYVAYIKKQLFN